MFFLHQGCAIPGPESICGPRSHVARPRVWKFDSGGAVAILINASVVANFPGGGGAPMGWITCLCMLDLAGTELDWVMH